MEKASQINRLPFEIPENEMVKMIVGCISEINLRNSLSFVMPKTVQDLIDHMSSIREKPKRKIDNSNRMPLKFPMTRESEKNSNPLAKRFKPDTDKQCYGCGKRGHIRSKCPNNHNVSDGSVSTQPPRKPLNEQNKNNQCNFCGKLGHGEATCWAKQRAENKNVNLCHDFGTYDNLTTALINKKLFRVLLDSGSDCSLIRSDVADRISAKRVPHFLSVQGIGAKPILLNERVDVTVEFEDLAVEVSFHIIDEKYLRSDAIIGRDVLKDPSLAIVVHSGGSSLTRNRDAMRIEKSNIAPLLIDLDTEDRQKVQELLGKFSNHFITGFPVARVTTGSLKIRLTTDTAVFYRPYHMAYSERQAMANIIEGLKQNNIIRDSHSPYASPALLVKKKNGQNRLCVDYRALKRITIKDRYPLPRIDDQLDQLFGKKWFTSLDMSFGFHQIPVAEDSIEKTAFVTPDCHFEYLCMPFGLANAPAVFQRAINLALRELLGKTALVYLDDVLVVSETVEEGLDKLALVIDRLIKCGFSFNFDKCKFFQTSMEYLGREVSADGIRPSKTKIDALVNSPLPANIKQVRQFMGLANFFRKFVPEFAVRTACITALTKNGVPFVWSEECESARQYIIDQLVARPLLVYFNPELPTELHTDASSLGYGAILFQRIDGQLHVVAYFSRATTAYEANYHSYELETLAVVNALKHSRHYLLGTQFLLMTDCNALKATKQKRNLLPRVAHWWMYLQDFDFEIVYRKGKALLHADYLSRNVPMKYCCHITRIADTWLHLEQENDAGVEDIKEMLKSGDSNARIQYVLKNGIL